MSYADFQLVPLCGVVEVPGGHCALRRTGGDVPALEDDRDRDEREDGGQRGAHCLIYDSRRYRAPRTSGAANLGVVAGGCDD